MSAESASRVEESFTSPTSAPALNEAVKTETYTGSGAAGAAGVLGTTTTTTTPTGTSADGSFTSADTTKNNAVNKVTETRTIPAGAVTRQTVSVAVNKDTIGGLNVADVTSLVSSAAGIDQARGDAVTVEVVSFNGQAAADAAAALAQQDAQTSADRMGEIVRIGMIIAAILITLILGMLLYARRSRRQSRESIEVDEMLQVRPALAPAAVPFGLGAPIAPIMIDPSPTVAFGVPAFTPPVASERMRVEIDALAQRDPKKTAEYLRGLMDDRQPA